VLAFLEVDYLNVGCDTMYSKIPLICSLVIWKSLLFTRIIFILEETDLRQMFEKSSKSISTLTVISPDAPSHTSVTSSAMKTPENTEEDPNDLEQRIKEIPEWNTTAQV
jgi:hypothetical protein